MDPNHEIEVELRPFVRIYKSGRVERLFGTALIPASLDPATAVASKDIIINPTTGLSARLYLPDLSRSPQNHLLPILVYYHGGAFIIESAFSPTYHAYLNTIAHKSNAVIVSIDYRRAPEHPLPAAHHDSLEALQWVFRDPDPWIAEHGDFARVFVAGDSAGGNLAHYVAMRAGGEGLKIEGLAVIHPYFAGSDHENPARRPRSEMIWRFVCPGTKEGLDDPLINPLATGAASLAGMGCRRVVVWVAERDSLRQWGRAYYEGLVASGWGGEAELLESEGEDHVFHLKKPSCEKALEMTERLVAMIKSE